MSETAAPHPEAKADPETFELRSKPARAIRFRRGLIIGAAGFGAVGVVAIAWMALRPHILTRQAQDSELSQPMATPGSDTLAGAPASYGDVPKLGPALPGDLGRPILRAQERTHEQVTGTRIDSAEAAREQQRAELKAAHQSGLLAQITSGSAAAAAPATFSMSISPGTTEPVGQSHSVATRKERFARVEQKDTASLNTHRSVGPSSPYSLLAGSVIPASLVTGLNSDLPGMVTAHVTQNVYDTATGRILLVPQGARLIGKYDSVVAFGQARALIVWQRLILPDGSSMQLDNMPATDAAGYAGLADKVDFHTWTLLKGVGIATLLGVGSELTIDGENDLVEAIREAAQSNTVRAGDRITQRALDVQPTITVRPGTPVRVLVTRDLIFDPIINGAH
jgi:type IV secretion system protein VirB10